MADAAATAARQAEKKAVEKVPFYKLFIFADKLDALLMVVGTIAAVGNGLAQPLMTLIFGDLINSFGGSNPSNVIHVVSKVIGFSLFQRDFGFFFFFFNFRG